MDARQARIAALEAENARLRAEIEHLKALVEELRRGGKRQAAPFSKGPPKPDAQTSGRKPGPDYGTKAFRQAPAHVDETFEAPLPADCPACGGRLVFEKTAAQFQDEIPRRPLRRQFNVHIGHCTGCGKRVQGRHPLQTSDALGAAASQVGPAAQALAVALNKEAGLSHGKVCRVFETGFGIRLSRGGSAQVMLRASRRCAGAHGEIERAVRASPWAVPDETGWRVGGRSHWLHVCVTPQATRYLVHERRGYEAAEQLLGAKYAGLLTHDGWAPYQHFLQARHTQCNAHLLRRCHELEECARGGAVRFPRQVKALLQAGLAWRDRYAAGAASAVVLKAQATRLQHRLEACCGEKANPDNERLAKFLWTHAHQVFNYLRYPGTDATNYRAEQAIRPAVVNRKVWGGNRTAKGAEAQGILVSVLRTAAQCGKNFVDFLAETFCALPAARPHLLPEPT